MRIFLTWLAMTFSIILASYLLPGVMIRDLPTAIVAAAILGIINAFLRPILLILTLPINILSLGLFTFVLNTLLILLTARLVDGFSVLNFWWGLLFSLLLSLIMAIISGSQEKK